MNAQTGRMTGNKQGPKVSNNESFIDEVTDEVRREKLYGYLRRYGWIAVACVLLLVGGAAFNEYRNAQARNQAQAVGDALFSALEESTPEDRAAALAAVDADGEAAAVSQMLLAATQEEAADIAGAAATLNALASDPDTPEMYRDLAAFKAATLPTVDTAARMAALDALSQPGQPFALLAQEQLAYLTLQGGDVDGAVEILRRIEEDAAVTRGLRERVQTLMVALGVPSPDPVTQ